MIYITFHIKQKIAIYHVSHYENPLKFSGKELDEITGLYDHVARNRNLVSTLWYGIDPQLEKYPDFSPYNYCAGNPVKFIDPDGKLLKDDSGNIVFQPTDQTTEDGEIKPIISRIDGTRYMAKSTYQNGFIFAEDKDNNILVPIPAMRLISIELEDDNGFKQELLNNPRLQKSLGMVSGYSVAQRLIEGARANCHGLSYADGKFWIDDADIMPLINAECYPISSDQARK